MAIKLYGNPHSTCNQRVAVVLIEKNVSFEQVTLEFDDGFFVYESRAIAKYIAKKYAGQATKLHPNNGDFKAYALFEQAFSAEQSARDQLMKAT
ncbi:hypothetical protein BKA61DRAFT_738143 [Leptodontidium sp. MPI-SDFR-AT-0119]|nr:hypothetical protein BKA61DRAFT_738143 [Leptodontidium sp. MPI-SDFR-AT-0119]